MRNECHMAGAISPQLQAKEQLARLKRLNANQNALYARRADVVATFKRVKPVIEEIITRKYEREYGLAVSAMDVPSARSFGRRFGDSILIALQGAFGSFDA